MSGQRPYRSSSQKLNDQRFSIDESNTEEEINLDEIHPENPPQPSQQSVNDASDEYAADADYDDAVDADHDDAVDTEQPPRCGWCCFRPGFLQCCRTGPWVLFALCLASTLQGMVINGFYTIDITTIERRFGLHSAQTGLIAASYDIASIISLIPITYLGGKAGASKPKWLGCGVFIMGLGSLVFAVPHFSVPSYKVDGNLSTLCYDEHVDTEAFSSGDLSYYWWVFFLGQFLHGLGTSPLFTLGVTYIDESVRTLNSSVFLAVYYTMGIVGTAFGYLFGGLLLRVFVNLSVDPSQFGLTPDSAAWVGAWWIGYLVSAVSCFVMAVWLLAFPPYLPDTPALRAEKLGGTRALLGKSVEDIDDDDDADDDADAHVAKPPGFARLTLDLCSNPTLFFINLAAASEGFINSGFIAFLPKFIENQYSMNPTKTSLIMGLIAVPTGGGGTFIGGYLVRRFELRCPGILKSCILTTFFALIFSTAFLFSCPNQSFAGVTALYPDGANLTLNQTCNEKCDCSEKLYDPICGIDNTIYYSPCFAGCVTELTCGKNKYYKDCKCVGGSDESCSEEAPEEEEPGRETRKVKEIPDHEAVEGKCKTDCQNLIPFTVLIVLVLFFTFMTAMPSLAASLRCVQEDQRSFALGLQWVTVRILGSTPSPILFGIVIDATCLIWKDGKGSCLVFDNSQLSFYMMLLSMVGKSFNMICYFIAWMCYVPVAEPEVDEKQEDEESLLSERNESSTYGTTYR